MPDYHVQWEIELSADNPEDAARKALASIADRNSVAHVFDVIGDDTEGETVRVDLDVIDEEKKRLTADIPLEDNRPECSACGQKWAVPYPVNGENYCHPCYCIQFTHCGVCGQLVSVDEIGKGEPARCDECLREERNNAEDKETTA